MKKSSKLLLQFLLAVLAVSFVASPVSAKDEVLVIKPGKKTLPMNFKQVRVGTAKAGTKRVIRLGIRDATLSPTDDSITLEVARSAIRFNTAPAAEGKTFNLKIIIDTEKQKYTRVGRIYKWVKTGNGTQSQSMTVVVDLDKFPKLIIPEGSEVALTLPPMTIRKLKNKREKYAEARLMGNQVMIRGKTVGSASFVIEYVLGHKTLKREIKVRVPKKMPMLTMELESGHARMLDTDKLEKMFDLPDWRIESFEVLLGSEVVNITTQSEMLQVETLNFGSAQANITVVGSRSGVQSYRVVVPLEITVAESS